MTEELHALSAEVRQLNRRLNEWKRRALAAEAALQSEGYKWPIPEPDIEALDVGTVYPGEVITEPAEEFNAVIADDRSWIDADD